MMMVVMMRGGSTRGVRFDLGTYVSVCISDGYGIQLTPMAFRSSSISDDRAPLTSGAAGNPTWRAMPDRIDTSKLKDDCCAICCDLRVGNWYTQSEGTGPSQWAHL